VTKQNYRKNKGKDFCSHCACKYIFYFVESTVHAVEQTIGKICSVNTDCKETGALCKLDRCYCSRFFRYDAEAKNCIKGIASYIFIQFNWMHAMEKTPRVIRCCLSVS
jgi:hypothetical protein